MGGCIYSRLAAADLNRSNEIAWNAKNTSIHYPWEIRCNHDTRNEAMFRTAWSPETHTPCLQGETETEAGHEHVKS